MIADTATQAELWRAGRQLIDQRLSLADEAQGRRDRYAVRLALSTAVDLLLDLMDVVEEGERRPVGNSTTA